MLEIGFCFCVSPASQDPVFVSRFNPFRALNAFKRFGHHILGKYSPGYLTMGVNFYISQNNNKMPVFYAHLALKSIGFLIFLRKMVPSDAHSAAQKLCYMAGESICMDSTTSPQ